MAPFDVVVNCTDGAAAPPERAAEYCLLSGKTFVEASSHPRVLRQLVAAATQVTEPTGTLVLGCGLAPGLTNLLAAALHAQCEGAQRLEVAVQSSLLSRAGAAACERAIDLLAEPAERFERGARVADPPLTMAGRVRWRGGERAVFGLGLAEAELLHRSTKVPTTQALLVPSALWPTVSQRLLALFAPWSLLRLGPLRWGATKALWLLRAGLLCWRPTKVELAAYVDRGRDSERSLSLTVSRGLDGAALAIAAIVARLRQTAPPRGVCSVDEVVTLDAVLGEMRGLAGTSLRLEGPTE